MICNGSDCGLPSCACRQLLPDVQEPRRYRDDQRGDKDLDLVDGAGVLALGVEHDESDEAEGSESGEDEDGLEGDLHGGMVARAEGFSHEFSLCFFGLNSHANDCEAGTQPNSERFV
jgi:hypothetical protein